MSKPLPLTARALVGTWRLASWQVTYPDGRITRPFGTRPQGRLLYTPDGGMSATVTARGRAPLAQANPRLASAEQRAGLFDTSFSYAGRYRVVGHRVRHDLAVAQNPALLGTPQLREARLTSGRLDLAASEPLPEGGLRRHVLTWTRLR
ncbi:MAG: lipocalin-like domain-containing protein [Steroidobacteraceae bacterium]